MEAALQLLLNILRIAAPAPGAAAPPLVLPADTAASLLAEFAPAATIAEISTFLPQAAQGAVETERVVPHLRRAAAQIALAATGAPDHAARMEGVTQELETIAAINQLAAGGRTVLRHVSISLAESTLPALVREWHVRTAETEPDVIVVSQAGARSGELVVRSRGKSYVERRVALRYHESFDHPWLDLHVLSAIANDERPRIRYRWRQRALPDYDLTIYTEQERRKGRVATRLLDQTVVVQGDVFTLRLPVAEGAYLLTTDYFDEDDRPLVRALRWPPLAKHPDLPATG
jgi:hypothetical protein